MRNDMEKILLTEEQVQSKVKELAAQITKDYEGKDPVCVGVLKGVVIFFADMIRNIDIPCQIDFMAASSYGKATKTSGSLKILKDLDIDVSGYDILIVEDILDSGVTLSKIIELLKSRNAK